MMQMSRNDNLDRLRVLEVWLPLAEELNRREGWGYPPPALQRLLMAAVPYLEAAHTGMEACAILASYRRDAPLYRALLNEYKSPHLERWRRIEDHYRQLREPHQIDAADLEALRSYVYQVLQSYDFRYPLAVAIATAVLRYFRGPAQ